MEREEVLLHLLPLLLLFLHLFLLLLLHLHLFLLPFFGLHGTRKKWILGI